MDNLENMLITGELKNKNLSEQIRAILKIMYESKIETGDQISKELLLNYNDILVAIRKGISNKIDLNDKNDDQEMVDYVVDLITNPKSESKVTSKTPKTPKVIEKKILEINAYSGFTRVDKKETPSWDDIKNGALVLYKNGYLETISGHIRFFNKRPDGTDEWTAGSSDDSTDLVDCWFKKVK